MHDRGRALAVPRASSSPSRSRRRSSRSTPGCPTPVARPRPAPRRCWSASWTRSAPSASCATACRCSRRRRAGSRRTALALALVGIIYAALLAVGQNDLKRLVSYTSIAHFGFIGIGIFAFTTQAGTGAVLYMLNHGLATGLLFLVVGMLVARRGSALISDFGGAGKLLPLLAGVLLLRRSGLAGPARHRAVRLRVPGADRHVHGEQDGGGDRHARASSWPRRTCSGWCSAPRRARSTRRCRRSTAMKQGPQPAGEGRGRAADRADPAPRLLPEAGAST